VVAKARVAKTSREAPAPARRSSKLAGSATGQTDFRTPPFKKPLDAALTGEPYRSALRAALRDSGLPRRIAHGALLPALLADGRMNQLREQIDWAIEDRVPAFYLAESFLQSYLFVGFPRVINALAMLHDVCRARRRSLGLASESLHVQTEIGSFDRILGGPTDFGMGIKGRRIRLAEGPPMHLEAPGEGPGSFERYAREWWRRGNELCQQVYGSQFERLRENLGRIHPELSDWLIFEGYGKVLARPVLTPRERELWIIPILMVLDVAEQLYSHLRGARNLEVPASRIQGALWLSSVVAGPLSLERALDRLDELERRDDERRREYPFG
jgi:alkylhydroperoxidase/carboxymuconolactone decarboxylase family protein YurZ